MCDVWKWLIIVTAVPLVLLRLYVLPPFIWMPGGKRTEEKVQKMRPYLRLWGLAAVVLIFAVVIYAIHCNP